MKTVIATNTPTTVAPLFPVTTAWLNPLRVLRAMERLNKFRALDDAALADAGLSHVDVSKAKLSDFLDMPGH